ncbi:PTS sugar transporter subunit IIC [Anaerosalibacter massiliensis]|uniref:PTS sugar transporter subunit IIC n=1 Tax=Anaerosalibacter massiliensis TaxID=1347392 RepID=UPI0005B2C4B0|nr:PTS sugar transporter subunit IIC [Anaerosalibacter massiliensis]
MKKFSSKISSWLTPVAMKFSNQRHLCAIRDGFVVLMPLVIVSSFFILINNVILDSNNGILRNIVDLSRYQAIGNQVYNGTLGFLSILIAFTVAYKLSEGYGEDGLISGVISVAVLVTMFPSTLEIVPIGADKPVEVMGAISQNETSATGLLFAIISALVGTEIFLRLQKNNKFKISLPDTVPLAVSKSFSALIPAFITLTLFGVIVFIIESLFGFGLQDLVVKLIQKPLSAVFQGMIGINIVMLFQNLLWSLGIHGTFVLGPITEPTLLVAIQENINAFNVGLDIPNIVTKPFIDSFAMLGGGGCTIGLIIAILIASKREEDKGIAKLSIAPGLFNINEPLMFGLPVILNPILAIPLILVPLINLNIAYIATRLGLISKTVVMVPWTTPPILSAYLSTAGDWRAAVLAALLIGISIIVYLPFVMATNIVSAHTELEDENTEI